MQWWCAAQGTAWNWLWTPYPGVWLFIGLLALLFRSMHRRAADDPSGSDAGPRPLWAAIGIILLWIALDWPVGALGAGYLASVHMVQFLLIAVAAPPLLLLGTPRSMLRRLAEHPVAGRIVWVLGYPIMALALFTALMGLTHWPWLADTLMSRQWGSFVLDMLWLFSGLVFWWPVAVNLPERDWLQAPFKMGYLIAATLVNTGVFAFLTFSDVPVYATFELAPPVGTLSTRDDQLIAGLLMKIGGAVVLWTSITILWFRWVRESDSEGEGGPTRLALLALLAAGLSVGCTGPGDAPAPDSAESGRVGAVQVDGLLIGPVVIGAPVTPERAALYLRLESTDREPDTLRGLTVEGVGEVTLHHTRESGGMMQMVHAPDGFAIAAGGHLDLMPGGDHAMLEAIAEPLAEGQVRAVVLRFARAGVVEVEARVVALTELSEALDAR